MSKHSNKEKLTGLEITILLVGLLPWSPIIIAFLSDQTGRMIIFSIIALIILCVFLPAALFGYLDDDEKDNTKNSSDPFSN